MSGYTRYPRPTLWLLRSGDVALQDTSAPDRAPAVSEVASFYISREPITNVQYEAYDPSYRRRAVSSGDDAPAVGVDYDSAVGYCTWYADVSRKPTRLPTEAEWEYACRGGTSTRYFFGETPDEADAYVWDRRNSEGRVRPVKQKKPNPFGLFGMLGTIWEWTEVAGDTNGARVLRGGSFRSDRDELACGLRRAAPAHTEDDDVGFRVVRPFAGHAPRVS